PPKEDKVYRWPEDMPRPSNCKIVVLQIPEQLRLDRISQRHPTLITSEEKKLKADMQFRSLVSEAYSNIEGAVVMDASQEPLQLAKAVLKQFFAPTTASSPTLGVRTFQVPMLDS